MPKKERKVWQKASKMMPKWMPKSFKIDAQIDAEIDAEKVMNINEHLMRKCYGIQSDKFIILGIFRN